MRGSRTLSFYIAREVIQYTLLGLFAITLVMVTRGVLLLLDKLVGAGFLLDDLFTLLRLLGTILLVYALPVSFLFGVLLAIGRMASDVEVTAMRACGTSVLGILAPVTLLSIAISGLTFAFTLDMEPAARRAMATAVRRMVVRGASVIPGRFNTVGGRTLYVDERDGANRMRGIMISDETDPKRPMVIFAESGEMRLDADKAQLVLVLEHGDLHLARRAEDDGRYQRLSFDRFEYKIDVANLMAPPSSLRPRDMPLGELRETVERIGEGKAGPLREAPATYATHLYQRYARPVAPVLFALVAVPLGMRRTRGARSFGALLCAGLAFFYYGLESACETAAVAGSIEPKIAMWIPNAIFAALGVALLTRARRAA